MKGGHQAQVTFDLIVVSPQHLEEVIEGGVYKHA